MDQQAGVAKEVERQFRIYTTLLEIVEERGYCIPENKKITSVKEFEINIASIERQVFFKDEDQQQKNALGLHCNFSGSKINDHVISKFLELFKANFETIIFVVPPSDKPGAAQADKQFQHKFLEQSSVRIEIFKQQDLLFNVLKHDLVPKHVILKDNQKADILAYYKVKESQLPKILTSDPVARFLGLRKGQVVKIIRKSETAGLYTTYRVAV